MGEELAIHTTEESWCSPPPLLSASTTDGLKLPFHCGQRFTLAGPAKSPEKSGLVKKGGRCVLSGSPLQTGRGLLRSVPFYLQ